LGVYLAYSALDVSFYGATAKEAEDERLQALADQAKGIIYADPAMTLRRYAHVLEDMEDEGGRAMDALF